MASFEGNLFGRGNGRHGLLGRPTVEWAGYELTRLRRSERNRTSSSCYAIHHTEVAGMHCVLDVCRMLHGRSDWLVGMRPWLRR